MDEDKACELKQPSKSFYIPYIKLVGYGRNQTYQCQCAKCGELYFNLTSRKNVEDLFCSFCEPAWEFLNEENFSDIPYVGIIVGWAVKSSHADKKRSFYNYKKVFIRDKYQCQYCGYCMRTSNEFRPLHVDHIRPWSASGGNSLNNLVVACAPCNQHASNKWFNSFQEKYEYILQKMKK
jgi:hypothetical protein